MTLPTQSEVQKMTPMMQQYYSLKAQAPNTIMFFRMGDFFEVFGDDATKIAPILEIVLTSRERGDKNKIPFCGVPHHAAKNYWLKLLKKGYKISIADQVESPTESKGLVKREIIKIITPGCIDELDGLPGDMPNYIMAAYEDPASKKWSAAVADISTGELRLGQLNTFEEVRACVGEFSPRELLLRRFTIKPASKLFEQQVEEDGLIIDALPEATLSDSLLRQAILEEAFGRSDLSSFPCSVQNQQTNESPIIGGEELVSALLDHIKSLKTELSVFRNIEGLSDPDTMVLGDTLIRDLELFETVRRRESKGSLLRQIDRTLTPMGARRSRWSLSRPLLKKDMISARHDCVEKLAMMGETQLNTLRQKIKGGFDLERLTTRILSGAATTLELAKIRDTLAKAEGLYAFISSHPQFSNAENVSGTGRSRPSPGEGLQGPSLSPSFNKCLVAISKSLFPLELLKTALAETPGPLGRGTLVFRTGFDSNLDKLTILSNNGQEKISEYESQLRTQTGISSLKIKPHKTFGLLIEVTKSNISKVPDSFIRRQTMVNCERFMTNDLKDLDETLASALELAVSREAELYATLLRSLATHARDLYEVADGLAQIDMLQSFAWLSIKEGYCRPSLSDQSVFQLINSRHPVVEHFVGSHKYVANTIEMDRSSKHLLITGPNMAGKSTVMRQTAICAILNQAGCFIPAKSATMPIFDQIFTRVGASDDLSRGQSTFMVEMSEAALILRRATSKSLVILDEVGRGTSTQDGLAIASAILENLALEIGCWSLFATHYHELATIAEGLATVKNMKTEVIETRTGIEFSHRLKPGVSGSSFGIEVAKLAGIPSSVIGRAQKVLISSEKSANSHQPNTGCTEQKERKKPRTVKPQGLELFGLGSIEDIENLSQNEFTTAPSPLRRNEAANFDKISEALRVLDMNNLTPMQAFATLDTIKHLYEGRNH